MDFTHTKKGKYFGFVAVVEFMVMLVSSSLFAAIYKMTVAQFSPTVFLIGLFICLFICYPYMM